MSDSDMKTLVCVIGVLFYAALLFLFSRLWRETNLSKNPSPKSAKEALLLFRKASDWQERLLILFLCSPALIRGGFGAGLITIATAGFASFAAICSSLDVAVLKEIRQMLLDFYNFIERLMHPSASNVQESIPRRTMDASRFTAPALNASGVEHAR